MSKVLAYIPARSGSKGVKDKNIRPFKGLPLMAHTILSALQAGIFSEVLVSTDSPQYQKIAIQYGASVPFLRSKINSSDTAPTLFGVLEALERYRVDFEHVVILQPTSPLRDAQDIQAAYALFLEQGCLPLASVHVLDDHPLLMRTLHHHRLTPLLPMSSTIRRQDLVPYYKVNGAIYIHCVATLSAQTSFNDSPIGYVMDPSHALDIDHAKDFDGY
ncbi:cytidylyltransferase domain-containing protein [Helicobacter baculiformis]|uniref:Cytidylyltransferase domain-containing protein n=1 Tax=Helicobacter baculiformis TaxID=427351 RepID=A0ABV7ZHN5_9HELI|nr:acylneuraminate cytidylyltransferase family protein [Helicobacter baculiformis]